MTRWALLALALLPTAAIAQTNGVMPFIGVNGSLPGSPMLVGLAGAKHAGALGFRVGAGVEAGGDGFPLPGTADAWAADLDVNLAPVRLFGGRGGLEPALFFGIGLEGGQNDDGSYATPNTSYGGALWYTPARWFRLESEVRRRSPIGDQESLPAGVAAGWEFRLGAAVLWSRSRTPTVATASRPDRLSPAPARPAPPRPVVVRDIAPDNASAPLASSVLGTAADYLGTPYRFGGTDPATGLDCSAFVQQVFSTHGISLPRTSRQQVQVGYSVDPKRGLQPGDLLFFASNGSRIDHVALYVGDNTIIHASGSGGTVRYDDLATRRGSWFADHLVGARRIIGTDLAAAAVIPMPADGELDPPDRAPQGH